MVILTFKFFKISLFLAKFSKNLLKSRVLAWKPWKIFQKICKFLELLWETKQRTGEKINFFGRILTYGNKSKHNPTVNRHINSVVTAFNSCFDDCRLYSELYNLFVNYYCNGHNAILWVSADTGGWPI